MGNDKISRQTLLDEINEEIEYGEEHFRPENEQINKGLKIARKLVKAAPSVDNGWISVEERLPHTERDVLITVDSGIGGYIIAIGFYEDGKRFAGDSACNWDNDYFDMMYNEDADDWIIPQGWYEGVMFGEEFTKITDKVVYWQPLPKPPKGECK